MRFKTANSSLVSGSGLVLSIHQICAYGSRDQAKLIAKINQIQSAMDARKLPGGLGNSANKDRTRRRSGLKRDNSSCLGRVITLAALVRASGGLH
jgi:hypothetical protein